MDESLTLVFVYGTLKRGCSNHASLRGQRFIGIASTEPGFRLFSLGQYPGMVRWEEDPGGVTGEVWEVDDDCLNHLDILEGVAEGLYRRERIPLKRPFDQTVVYGYLYALSIEGRPDLGSTWTE